MNDQNDVGNSAKSLVKKWNNRARKAFECGENTEDPMGKRLVEHGGTIYANCAMELERVINAKDQEREPSPGSAGCQRSETPNQESP